MAVSIYAALTIGGIALRPNTTSGSVGGVDTRHMIEIFSFTFSRTGSNPIIFSPIRIRKRTTGNTPQLWEGANSGDSLDGIFHFFAADTSTPGTREESTIMVSGGTIDSITTTSPDSTNPDLTGLEMYDIVEFTPHSVDFTNMNTGDSAQWNPS